MMIIIIMAIIVQTITEAQSHIVILIPIFTTKQKKVVVAVIMTIQCQRLQHLSLLQLLLL